MALAVRHERLEHSVPMSRVRRQTAGQQGGLANGRRAGGLANGRRAGEQRSREADEQTSKQQTRQDLSVELSRVVFCVEQ
ncbi:hypothetical protein Vi05172_g5273 [Venturia inaequalis]|nr:hypothetical protein Vi05172_g5273 [Venturia inaequalis]